MARTAEQGVEGRDGSGAFRSLANRNYRRYFVAGLISKLGTWVQRTAQAWLVLQLPGGNAVSLGGVLGLQFLPMLLMGAFAGPIIDRHDKRRLIAVTQASAATLAVLLGILDLAGVVQVWHVYLLALGLGLSTAVDTPARRSLIIELVGGPSVANAIALNSMTSNVARLVGPAIGGYGIEWIGTGWMFVLNGASFVAMIVAVVGMDDASIVPAQRVARAPKQFREGLRYVMSSRVLLVTMVVGGLVQTFGQNFQLTIPIMATEVYGRGPAEFGLMTSMAAVGSLAGAYLAARRARPRLRYIIGGALAFGTAEVIAGTMPGYLACGLLLIVVGICQQTFTTSANAVIQLSPPPQLRGRATALYTSLSRGGTAVGAPVIGAIAAALGPRWSMISGGLIAVLAAVGAGLVMARGSRPAPEAPRNPRGTPPEPQDPGQ